jgi:hypothetical protein
MLLPSLISVVLLAESPGPQVSALHRCLGIVLEAIGWIPEVGLDWVFTNVRYISYFHRVVFHRTTISNQRPGDLWLLDYDHFKNLAVASHARACGACDFARFRDGRLGRLCVAWVCLKFCSHGPKIRLKMEEMIFSTVESLGFSLIFVRSEWPADLRNPSLSLDSFMVSASVDHYIVL